MKLSENSLAVLKNFSTIEGGMVLKEGKRQRTCNEGMTILAEVNLDDEIPIEFAMWEIHPFLSNIANLGGPEAELDWNDDRVKMTGTDGMSITIQASSPEMVLSPPDKELPEFETEIEFDLPKDKLDKIKKMAALNGFDYIELVGDGSKMFFRTFASSKSANMATMPVGETTNEFKALFKLDNLKLLPMDYHVRVNLGQFVVFQAPNVKYFVVLSVEDDQ